MAAAAQGSQGAEWEDVLVGVVERMEISPKAQTVATGPMVGAVGLRGSTQRSGSRSRQSESKVGSGIKHTARRCTRPRKLAAVEAELMEVVAMVDPQAAAMVVVDSVYVERACAACECVVSECAASGCDNMGNLPVFAYSQ